MVVVSSSTHLACYHSESPLRQLVSMFFANIYNRSSSHFLEFSFLVSHFLEFSLLVSHFLEFCIRVPKVGDPIHVEKNDNPTLEETIALHDAYVQALIQLYEENKSKYGYDHVPLVIK